VILARIIARILGVYRVTFSAIFGVYRVTFSDISYQIYLCKLSLWSIENTLARWAEYQIQANELLISDGETGPNFILVSIDSVFNSLTRTVSGICHTLAKERFLCRA
jgi:hypothetical protein